MTLATLLDAVQVHALAAAQAAGGAKFYDVAVRYPSAKGRHVDIFHGGEREPVRMGANETFNSEMTGVAIIVRALWPLADYAADRQRALEIEIGTFIEQMRTRIDGDKQLGGAATDLSMGYFNVQTEVVARTKYVCADAEITVTYSETTIAP